MSLITSDAPHNSSTPWLLTPPPPAQNPRPSEPEAGILELLVAVTGAPTAIPPALWNTPVRCLSFADTRDLINQICTALAERIPFLHYDFLEWEDDLDALFQFLQIPVDPIGIDTCNGEVVGYGAVLAWVAAICGYTVDELPFPLPQEMPVGFEVWELAPSIAKRYQGQVLAGLADVIDMLNHDTGTFFLDACPACWYAHADDFTEWTDENIRWLEEDAARTLMILERIDELEVWVKAKPTRIALVWQTLLEAYDLLQAQSAPSAPKTLMEVWGLIPQEADGAGEGDMDEVRHGGVA